MRRDLCVIFLLDHLVLHLKGSATRWGMVHFWDAYQARQYMQGLLATSEITASLLVCLPALLSGFCRAAASNPPAEMCGTPKRVARSAHSAVLPAAGGPSTATLFPVADAFGSNDKQAVTFCLGSISCIKVSKHGGNRVCLELAFITSVVYGLGWTTLQHNNCRYVCDLA